MVEEANYTVFRDCLAEVINARSHTSEGTGPKRSRARGRKRTKSVAIKEVEKPTANQNIDTSDDLSEFVEYIAAEIFPSLPEEIRTLCYKENLASIIDIDATLSLGNIEKLSSSTPLSVEDSLSVYGLMDTTSLLKSVLPPYASSVTAPPPIWVSTRSSACEICDRDWINLTYHHLIPRSVHEKAVKRGWHEEWELNRVAWICGACHRYVHSIATNEELAQHWDTVEKLLSREDVQRFAQWVGKVRWKKK